MLQLLPGIWIWFTNVFDNPNMDVGGFEFEAGMGSCLI